MKLNEPIACQTDAIEHISCTNELLSSNWLTDDTVQKYTNLLNTKIIKGKFCTIINLLIVCAVKNLSDSNVFLDPLDIKTKELLVMPLNNSVNLTQKGGSHWSLLVYCKSQKKFLHYDSIDGYNKILSRLVAENFFKYLEGRTMENECNIEQIKGSQQINNFDCGVYMISAIEVVMGCFLNRGK